MVFVNSAANIIKKFENNEKNKEKKELFFGILFGLHYHLQASTPYLALEVWLVLEESFFLARSITLSVLVGYVTHGNGVGSLHIGDDTFKELGLPRTS